MTNLLIREVETKQDMDKFISLPSRLYDKKYNTQNKTLEKQILNRTHPLSTDFNIIPYIVLRNEKVITRAILTIYSNDTTAYLGFFESENSLEAVELLLSTISFKLKQLGNINRILGPIDCSIWLKYRFKIDKFESIYTGEPYNLPYYKTLWELAGFKVCESYYSNRLRVPLSSDASLKFKSRMKSIVERGIEIRNVTHKSFDTDLESVYELMTKTYSDFPAYKTISKQQFIQMFSKLKFILDSNFAYVAYSKANKLLGFMICIPNYKKSSILRTILKMKHQEYIMMYLGADKEGYGLGGTFAELCRSKLEEYNSTSILALIHQGNKSGVFYRELTVDKYNYVLLSKELN